MCSKTSGAYLGHQVLREINALDRKRPYYIVVMVRSADGVANAIKRIGIGIIHKQALGHSLIDEMCLEDFTLV
jgi:hypothetical protein